MNLLDMRTIVLINVVTDIVCVWFVVILWLQNRDRFAGTAFWVLDFVFQTAALILIVPRGAIPDWMSMVLSNTLVIAGAILGFLGLERFVGKKGTQIYNYILLTLFVFVHSYFTLVQPSLAVRNLNLSVALLLVCFQCLWLLWRRVEPGLRSLTFGVGVVFFLLCLVSAVRIVEYFVGAHAENNYLHSGLFDALMLVSYQVLFILLTYSLVLMVNKRLLMLIGTQEEKFAKAFHSAPYAITLTRPSDGTIIDVNETFTSITGYDRSEVMGKNTTDLHLWERDEDRIAVVDALSSKGSVQGMEMPFRKKNGDGITGLFSAEIILIDGEKSILSSIGDITERKRVEEALRESEQKYRVLFEGSIQGILATDIETGRFVFANPYICQMFGYSETEFLQLSITDIHPKDSLDRLMSDVKAQIRGEQSGSRAVPCLRKDSTVFYADIAGSSTIISGQRCVVGFFTDVTERKRFEDALRKSEERYRELSILDDLTQLYNSRYFYVQLKSETERSNRYRQFLTLLLLDIDDFKRFNDAYGHVEGDKVLWRLGQVVKRCLRQTDSAFRYGGEEFTILLPMTTSVDGAVTAERIRTEFKKETFSPAPGQNVHVTVSIGLAQYRTKEEMKAFVHRVDQLMYQGKKNGKDRVCCES